MPFHPSARRAAVRALAAAALLGCHDATAPDVAKTPIAYSLVRDTPGQNSGADIYAVAPDGGGARRLIESDSSAYLNAPAWSRDGRRLAYQRFRVVSSFSPTLWVADADGSHRQRLPAVFDGGTAVAWSPDGTRLAYASARGLGVAALDGSRAASLGAPEVSLGSQAWSPDGARILFTERPSGGSASLWTATADGLVATRLPLAGCVADGAWSPDGTHVAFADCADPLRVAIEVALADGSARTPVSVPPLFASDGAPSWSADGRSIAFTRVVGASGVTHVEVAPAVTSGSVDLSAVRDVTPAAFSANAPAWRP